MFGRLALEELNTAAAQGDGYLNRIFLKDQFRRWWEKIGDDSNLVDFAFSVNDCVGHRFVSPCANNLRRKCECGLPGT